ncbi:type IV toxin-antitoxin system AbiEi family antitoxin domain-containing protein [Streptomyces olivaceus]|uniref:Type IV toxin-antitoxin system AbiEi family antitoxin domain-containing protein n=1 Tax=Streptomyces olivaceus TaxID=47716 RepID=A0ABS7WEZ5_STROV|nr:type IV toxin-antitoxin system AbiEi family antitoxin domain-containing protein [Streptomyces olivaceus]MBZ6093713.1 type IV toxin-antitoxin system AbiEi family antitoxin domain-containing protein [Streptomyces olivaceus]MBZ6100778.1 type IV toxin-antitoxin system AbiEi family antitoxin domain-containing protein [Streptomyces olivaceus]MBZ6121885.1 type IV toxin-antitoxin system AbiEi family antitoxin domain-containing protein [Streptomyces olivaceus]MBZ6156548.1 type IV toxin-antitoxin syst
MAADQWGLVTAAQAKDFGISAVQLLRLTQAGQLENVGRGVYALPAAGLPRFLEIKVAWLRLQPRVPAWQRPPGSRDSGVVSHACACQLHGLGDIPAPEVEISVPRRRTTTEPFVKLRTAALEPADITMADGLPVTTVTRTITDLLRARTDGGHTGGVIADAERRDLVDLAALATAVQPYARNYGLPAHASGQDLIEHLVGQAGRVLHAQEVVRAGREGLAVGAELGALDQLMEPYRQMAELAEQALTPYREMAELAEQAFTPYREMESLAQSVAAVLEPYHRARQDIEQMVSGGITAQTRELLSGINAHTQELLDGINARTSIQEALRNALPRVTDAVPGLTAGTGLLRSAALTERHVRRARPVLPAEHLTAAVQALNPSLALPSVMSPQTRAALQRADLPVPDEADTVPARQAEPQAAADRADRPGGAEPADPPAEDR